MALSFVDDSINEHIKSVILFPDFFGQTDGNFLTLHYFS